MLTAEDGAEALNLALNNPNFDLLVTDYQMPRLNGGQLAKSLRERNFEQPIIVWTALVVLPEVPEAQEVISKRSGRQAILEKINDHL